MVLAPLPLKSSWWSMMSSLYSARSSGPASSWMPGMRMSLRHPKFKVSTPAHRKTQADMLIWGPGGTPAESHPRWEGTLQRGLRLGLGCRLVGLRCRCWRVQDLEAGEPDRHTVSILQEDVDPPARLLETLRHPPQCQCMLRRIPTGNCVGKMENGKQSTLTTPIWPFSSALDDSPISSTRVPAGTGPRRSSAASACCPSRNSLKPHDVFSGG